VELLTIRIRLDHFCSIDKAQGNRPDWWKYDRHLSPGRDGSNSEEPEAVKELERKVALLTASPAPPHPPRDGAAGGETQGRRRMSNAR